LSNYPDDCPSWSHDDEDLSGCDKLSCGCYEEMCECPTCEHCGEKLDDEEECLNACEDEEAGCQCKDPNCKVWIDCTVGTKHPLPARYSIIRKYARSHWTLSPRISDLETRKKTVVDGVKCSFCMLAVDLYV